MTLEKLEKILHDLGIPDDLYMINNRYIYDDCLCIKNEDGWKVYYCERGKKLGLKEFSSEEEACEYFLDEIKREYFDDI